MQDLWGSCVDLNGIIECCRIFVTYIWNLRMHRNSRRLKAYTPIGVRRKKWRGVCFAHTLYLLFQQSWPGSKTSIVTKFQNHVTIQIVIWNRMYGLPFLHFANFSPYSSHTLLLTIVSIQWYRYRDSHIGFKSVVSIEVMLALKAAFVCKTLKLCIMCVIFTYFMQNMYDIIICFVYDYL